MFLPNEKGIIFEETDQGIQERYRIPLVYVDENNMPILIENETSVLFFQTKESLADALYASQFTKKGKDK